MPKKGYKQTDAHKKKISDAIKGKKGYWFGKHRSEETKKKISIAMTGEKNPNYGRTGDKNPMYGADRKDEKNPNWKEDGIICINAIHKRAHKIQPKPTDGKCAICHQVADKKGRTKLVHSNKDHTYRLPINPDEWHWVHQSCHIRYDVPKIWTPEKRKEQANRMKELWEKGNLI